MDKKQLLNEILQFESDEKILSYKFSYDNQPMWPYIRYNLLDYFRFHLLKENYDTESSVQKDYLNKVSVKSRLVYIQKLLQGRLKILSRKKIIFTSSNVYNTERKNGKWFNWLHDPYASLYEGDSLIMERSYCFTFFDPRFFKNIIPYDDMFIISAIIKKIKKPSAKDKKEVRDFVQYIKAKCKYEIDPDLFIKLESKLLNVSKVLSHECSYWNRILSKVKPQVIFIDEGSYGGAAHIIKLAHKHGITCCELQHGMIDELHLAYNYHDAIIHDRRYQACMPDYFLTFGEYWNSKNNSSSTTIVVGNPKINPSLHNKKTESGLERKKNIVFISDYLIADFFIDTITELVNTYQALDEYNIYLRPHPSDFNIFNKYRDLSDKTGIQIVENETIKQTLEKADAIISEGSTVIFEALCFNIKILIRDTKTSQLIFGQDIGTRFKTASDLYHMLSITNWDENEGADSGYYFDANWKSNYINFIESVIQN